MQAQDNKILLANPIERALKLDCAVIVEGIRDKRALKTLGFRHVFTINKPLYALAEEVASCYKQVIILTDLDAEGKRLYRRLKRELQRLGVRIEDGFRLAILRHTKIRQIEGLRSVENV
ncbi:hypothetical protein COV22_01675 [Candidatus Woesearchaeota archaeon CG10_big_fil_rev_8_21_14_0_10_47_5]|nr:MAG: hypothetical protein COV22_01675 [Candidatus Woesearchaeota archaeon CG10_big_fil_rev_8_21_14_0_10_47_5]